MTLIRLDASGWLAPADFYDALLPCLAAPDWHGRNLDALYDGLCGGVNGVEAPLRVEIGGSAALPPAMQEFLAGVGAVFAAARAGTGAEVRFVLR